MATKIYVNLPVRDLPRSMAFFRALGFEFHPEFTGETGACMIISEDIYAMLLTHEKFQGFTPKPICDATQGTEVITCISRESRTAVDEMVRLAAAHGGSTYAPPQDHGFMYQHGFQDPDGHIWDSTWSARPPRRDSAVALRAGCALFAPPIS